MSIHSLCLVSDLEDSDNGDPRAINGIIYVLFVSHGLDGSSLLPTNYGRSLPLNAVALNHVQTTSHAPPATASVNQGVAIFSQGVQPPGRLGRHALARVARQGRM
jgi:hypothetical protein